MSKDYAKRQHKEAKPIPGWVWLSAGLIIGLFVALLVYINDNGSNKLNLSEKVSKAFKTNKSTDTRAVKKNNSEAPTKKPKFDFYTILPELEVAIPEQDLLDVFKDNQSKKIKHHFILQAGSFRKFAEADRLRALLVLEGIEANIQKVKINENDTWHRVRIGPLTTSKELNKTRRRLRDLGIASIVIKNKS